MKYCPTCQHCYEDGPTVCPDDDSSLAEARAGAALLAGKYRLDVLLGRGDQGTAYEATELGNGRPVIAVELQRAEVLSDPDALGRFHAAAQAAGRNNGQEVGEVRDSGPLPGGGAYVVMELKGEDTEEFGVPAVAPGRADTPAAAPRGADTGRLRPPGRNTGRLSQVAAEITQEVRRIPSPPPPEPARPAAPLEDAGVTREVSAPPQPRAAPARQVASVAAGRPSEPVAVGIPHGRTRRRRRRPPAYYLTLALIGIACVLLLVYAFTLMRRGTDADAVTGTAATQSQATGASAPSPSAGQQTAAPTAGQTGPAAAGAEGAQPANATTRGGTTAARSAARGAGGEDEVREVLDDWVAAAAAGNVGRLMAFYAPELEAFYGRRDVKSSSLRAELNRLYGRAEKVEARILGEPRISFEEGGRVALVRLRLGYSVEGKGRKTRRGEVTQRLRLVKADGAWKISGQRGENMLS